MTASPAPMRKGTGRRVLAVLALLLVLAVALVVWLNVRGDAHGGHRGSPALPPEQLVERGAYLAKVGNCAACHTQRGGESYAGARGIATPFGTVYASNLTPDDDTGIGRWSSDDFWRAMHNGRSKDGRLLYPAFPYPNYTQVSREDADALHAYLRTLPPVKQANRPHELRFPYSSQAALAVWRALFFTPEAFEPEPAKGEDWNRGAYLARGLGHCVACHSTRNALGATQGALELGGGLMPLRDWYAPSLADAKESGVAGWRTEDVMALLRTGTSPHGSVLGPMAEVVFRSTQYLSEPDLRAMAVFLQALPQAPASTTRPEAPTHEAMVRGAEIYKNRCADCHGAEGQGAPGAYPPLAGSRKLTMPTSTNVVRVIVDGGFPPATAGHPRPYGMPPFGHVLNQAEIADVATYIRNAWGNQAAPVTELDVSRAR